MGMRGSGGLNTMAEMVDDFKSKNGPPKDWGR